MAAPEIRRALNKVVAQLGRVAAAGRSVSDRAGPGVKFTDPCLDGATVTLDPPEGAIGKP